MSAEIVLDSNIVLRLLVRGDQRHTLVEAAVANALDAGFRLRLCPQVVMESWVVLTRPKDVNGFGWTTTAAAEALDWVMKRFPLLPETEDVFAAWWETVKEGVSGKRAHDARLAAAMKVHGVRLVMTWNIADFSGLANIVPFAPGTNPPEIFPTSDLP